MKYSFLTFLTVAMIHRSVAQTGFLSDQPLKLEVENKDQIIQTTTQDKTKTPVKLDEWIRTSEGNSSNWQGKHILRYANGQLKYELDYENGKQHGPIIHYYENGVVMFAGAYKEGHMSGPRMYYNAIGQLLHGHFVIMNNVTGQKEREGICVKGKPVGEFKLYVDGILRMKINFKDGLPDGLTYNYGLNGKISSIEKYKDGDFVEYVPITITN